MAGLPDDGSTAIRNPGELADCRHRRLLTLRWRTSTNPTESQTTSAPAA